MKDFLDISYIGFYDSLFHRYTDKNYWNGTEEIQSFPEKSPVGDIFISEYDRFRKNCLVELNPENLNGKSIRDSSGQANSGILIGDYSIKKDEPGESTVKDSFMKIAKLGSSGGAF